MAASSSRGARSRPTSSGCRFLTGWRARFCIPDRDRNRRGEAWIGDQVPLKDATRQWANVGGLVAALYTSDLALLSRSLVDHIAEPKRALLVPGLGEIKAAAMSAGALGCSLSGSGPSVFALAATLDIARAAGDAMQRAFDAGSTVGSDLWVCPVGRQAQG